jgi:hypothetical protein
LARAPPGRQRVAEGPRRVQEDAQRHQVKGDRRERLEVLGAGELFAVDAVDGQAPEADAQLVVEQRLRVREVSQPGVGVGHVGELDREVVADVFLGQARARVVGEADVQLAAGPAEELVGVEEEVEAEEVVFAKAPPPPALTNGSVMKRTSGLIPSAASRERSPSQSPIMPESPGARQLRGRDPPSGTACRPNHSNV